MKIKRNTGNQKKKRFEYSQTGVVRQRESPPIIFNYLCTSDIYEKIKREIYTHDRQKKKKKMYTPNHIPHLLQFQKTRDLTNRLEPEITFIA